MRVATITTDPAMNHSLCAASVAWCHVGRAGPSPRSSGPSAPPSAPSSAVVSLPRRHPRAGASWCGAAVRGSADAVALTGVAAAIWAALSSINRDMAAGSASMSGSGPYARERRSFSSRATSSAATSAARCRLRRNSSARPADPRGASMPSLSARRVQHGDGRAAGQEHTNASTSRPRPSTWKVRRVLVSFAVCTTSRPPGLSTPPDDSLIIRRCRAAGGPPRRDRVPRRRMPVVAAGMAVRY